MKPVEKLRARWSRRRASRAERLERQLRARLEAEAEDRSLGQAVHVPPPGGFTGTG